MEVKYSWFQNHESELSYTIIHTEDDVETIIAITNNAEKADFISKACNDFNKKEHNMKLFGNALFWYLRHNNVKDGKLIAGDINKWIDDYLKKLENEKV